MGALLRMQVRQSQVLQHYKGPAMTGIDPFSEVYLAGRQRR